MLTHVARENRALFNLDRAPEGMTFGQLRAASVTFAAIDALANVGAVNVTDANGKAHYALTPTGSDELRTRIANGVAYTVSA